MSGEWEGGRHQGVAWRRLLAATVAAAVVAAGWWLARRDGALPVETDGRPVTGATEPADVVVTSPLPAGRRWLCPSGFPIRAAEGRYYPVHYPPEAAVGRPQRCFADVEVAQEAGYRLAAAPPDAVVAGGVYVMPAGIPRHDVCREVARDVGFTVPCPMRLPAPAYGPSCREGRCVFRGGVVIEQRAVALPDHWCETCPARVVVTAANRRSARNLVTCHEGERLPRLQPDRFAIDRCPPESWIPGIGGHPHAGNPVMRWRRGSVTYAVSVEATGPDTDVLALVNAVVEGIEYVAPP